MWNVFYLNLIYFGLYLQVFALYGVYLFKTSFWTFKKYFPATIWILSNGERKQLTFHNNQE